MAWWWIISFSAPTPYLPETQISHCIAILSDLCLGEETPYKGLSPGSFKGQANASAKSVEPVATGAIVSLVDYYSNLQFVSYIGAVW